VQTVRWEAKLWCRGALQHQRDSIRADAVAESARAEVEMRYQTQVQSLQSEVGSYPPRVAVLSPLSCCTRACSLCRRVPLLVRGRVTAC
jgi:hypothetical protein